MKQGNTLKYFLKMKLRTKMFCLIKMIYQISQLNINENNRKLNAQYEIQSFKDGLLLRVTHFKVLQ